MVKLLFKQLKKKPIRLRFFKSIMFPRRSKAEWKLIDKNPFGDADRDRVPNIFDCKPLNRKKQGWAHSGTMLYYPDQVTKVKMMTPDKFLRTTFHEKNNTDFNKNFKARSSNWTEYAVMIPNKENMKRYSEGVINPENVEKLKKIIRSSKGEMDIPYLQLDSRGRPISHEGRHRAMASKELGIKLIPVSVSRSKSFKDYGEAKTIKQLDEYRKRREKEIMIQEKESIEHDSNQSSTSADIPIQEQREYGKEKPETLKALSKVTDIQPIKIVEED